MFIESWNAKDLDGLVGLLAEKVTARNPLTQKEIVVPKAAFRGSLQANMAMFPDLTMRVDRLIIQGEGVAIEEVEKSTYTPTGRFYVMPVACFMRVNPQGEIYEMHNYWDTATYFQQLDTDPASFMKAIYGTEKV